MPILMCTCMLQVYIRLVCACYRFDTLNDAVKWSEDALLSYEKRLAMRWLHDDDAKAIYNRAVPCCSTTHACADGPTFA